MLGLRKSHWGSTSFPFAALLEEFDALEAFENGTFAADGGIGLEAIVLGHLGVRLKVRGRRKLGTPFPRGNPKKAEFFRVECRRGLQSVLQPGRAN